MANEIEVTLDQQRLYRANHEDRHAIAVGPGTVTVPLWVAQEWGFAPKPESAKATVTPTERAGYEEQIAALQTEVQRLQGLLDATQIAVLGSNATSALEHTSAITVSSSPTDIATSVLVSDEPVSTKKARK